MADSLGKNMNKYRDYLSKYSVLLFIIIGLSAFFILCWKRLLEKNSIEEISYFIFFATAILAYIAYVEFQRANKLTNNEFLLFISNRWGSKEIIIARQIIHEFFVKNYRAEKSIVVNDYSGALHHTGRNVLELSRKSGDEGKEFIYLLNLIDFLETLSYFYSRKDLDIEDIQNICGHNFIFLCDVFRLYKERRQSREKFYFRNIDRLYIDLKDNLQKMT